MFTISECYIPNFAMEAIGGFPGVSPDRVPPLKDRAELEPPMTEPSSPEPVTGSSPKESSHRWWDVLKGLGRRRRKSSSSTSGDDVLEVTWQLAQVEKLSEEKNNEEYVTSLAYDETGELLAAGCKDGKVSVFRQEQEDQRHDQSADQTSDGRQFHAYSSFQSHEKQFDHQRSVETDAKICKLRFLKRPNRHHLLLSTNERIVKLWKLTEKRFEFDDNDAVRTNDEMNSTSLRIPTYRPAERTTFASPKRSYFPGHSLRMNSLSVNSDLETFLTADDLTINLWHVEVPDLSFNIVDANPDSIDNLSEVITAAEFHPSACSQFAYASSKGCIRLCDMRSNALCDQHSKLFHDTRKDDSRNAFSDITCSISDVKFSYDGQYLMSRDYLNLKVWDLRQDSHPVETYAVCDLVRGKLSKLHENDQIYDIFDCSWSYDDRFISTGTYGNYFKVIDRISGHSVMSSADRTQRKRKLSISSKALKDEFSIDRLDFRKKCAHVSWHPTDHILTSVTADCLNIFHGRRD